MVQKEVSRTALPFKRSNLIGAAKATLMIGPSPRGVLGDNFVIESVLK